MRAAKASVSAKPEFQRDFKTIDKPDKRQIQQRVVNQKIIIKWDKTRENPEWFT